MDASICNIEYVSEKRLQQMMGDISSSTVWRYVQAGILPQPRQIGPNRKAWLRHELEQKMSEFPIANGKPVACLLYTSPSPRDGLLSRMPSSA